MAFIRSLGSPALGCLCIRVTNESLTRFASTCFRGTNCRAAGNFLRWEDFLSLFAEIGGDLVTAAESVIRYRDDNDLLRTGHVEIELACEQPVGWSSTESKERFDRRCLERRGLGQYAQALFVTDEGKLAPLTNVMTFVCRVMCENGRWVVDIKSIHPGPSVGRLKGDVTARTGRVFFPRDQPGQPIAP